MKKLILFFLLMGLAPVVNSQILISLLLGDKLNSDALEFGLEGGLNWSSISGFESNNYRRSFNLGFYFDFRIKNQWNFYTGVLVKSQLGTEKLTENDRLLLEVPIEEGNGSYSQVINYFIVPALIKYRFKNYFYLEAGPQAGLRYSAWTEYTLKSDNSDVRVRDYNEEKINRIDAGITAGIGYKLLKGKGFTFGFKYYQGLANVYKGVNGKKNRSFFVKVNIPIGAGKQANKPAEDKG